MTIAIFLCLLFPDSNPKGQDPPPFVNPFNQGNSLFETPYSGSINAMGGGSGGFMQSMMTMNGGGGRNGLPSMFMKDGKLQMGHQQCLKNIVCPQYCHEVDEDGCETCPCGPGTELYVVISCPGDHSTFLYTGIKFPINYWSLKLGNFIV